jgi:hypothetical protein
MIHRRYRANRPSENGERAVQAWSLVGLLALLASATAMVPAAAQAQAVTCPTPADPAGDPDGDGFTSAEECAGIQNVLACQANVPPEFRPTCLDPNSKDIFIIVLAAPQGSLIPADPLSLLPPLGATVHQLSVDVPDRRVGATQHALRITESLDPVGSVVGQANYGTPNNLDEAVVFTQRIADHVNSVHAAAGAPVPAGLIDTYVKHTIAHELGHMLKLTTDYNARFGGHHYKSGSVVVMEQAVSYTSKGGTVRFNVSTNFAAPDPGSAVFE